MPQRQMKQSKRQAAALYELDVILFRSKLDAPEILAQSSSLWWLARMKLPAVY